MLQRVRIKVCGLRDPRQAVRIAQMGADAIGLVFASSPRWVSPEQARAVTEVLPPLVWAVGVFVNDDAATINRTVARAGLDLVQLHGDEPAEMLDDLAAGAIKAFAVRGPDWIDDVRRWLEAAGPRRPAAILLDTHDPSARGGTGRRFNWQWVVEARLAGKTSGLPPLLLSGGLDAAVVSDAIDAVQPWAVDVSTGVESHPGVKDLKKVEDFIRATREGDVLDSESWR